MDDVERDCAPRPSWLEKQTAALALDKLAQLTELVVEAAEPPKWCRNVEQSVFDRNN
jgi:hypothetical protein